MASYDPVDWGLAERVGTRVANRNRTAGPNRAPAPTTPPDLLADFPRLVAQAEPLVSAETGLVPPTPAEARVVDRAEWVSVNITAFQRLLRPLLDSFGEKLATASAKGRPKPEDPSANDGDGEAVAPSKPLSLGRKLAGTELGMLLGWMSRRVLGQYDLLVTDDPTGIVETATAPADIVYVVGPNLAALEQRFGFPPEEFRLWVALHECTHRAQFTGVPWMRGYFLGLVQEAMSMADVEPGELLSSMRRVVQNRSQHREQLQEGGMLAVLATPEQRAAMQRIGGLMSLLEGHGDVTMDRAGADLIPNAQRFSRVLRERRKQANPFARFVQRMTGLEAKLNQYAAGERFIATVESVAGSRVIDRCWEGPENLPTMDEIKAPERWLERMDVRAAVA
jgi:coenzyme F420 biosynthesis associated uncharacterized protein